MTRGSVIDRRWDRVDPSVHVVGMRYRRRVTDASSERASNERLAKRFRTINSVESYGREEQASERN